MIRGWFWQRAALVRLVQRPKKVPIPENETYDQWVFAKNDRPLEGVYLTKLIRALDRAIVDEPWVPLSTAEAMRFDDELAPARALAAPRATFELDEQRAT